MNVIINLFFKYLNEMNHSGQVRSGRLHTLLKIRLLEPFVKSKLGIHHTKMRDLTTAGRYILKKLEEKGVDPVRRSACIYVSLLVNKTS